jgi:hypothetical protein
MELLSLADLGSGLVGAAHAYIHENRSQAMQAAAFNIVARRAGRWISVWLSQGWFDTLSFSLLKPATKNYLAVYLARWVIGYVRHEKNCMAKSWDTMIQDAFATELTNIFNGGDRILLGGLGSLYSKTGPVAGAGFTPSVSAGFTPSVSPYLASSTNPFAG